MLLVPFLVVNLPPSFLVVVLVIFSMVVASPNPDDDNGPKKRKRTLPPSVNTNDDGGDARDKSDSVVKRSFRRGPLAPERHSLRSDEKTRVSSFRTAAGAVRTEVSAPPEHPLDRRCGGVDWGKCGLEHPRPGLLAGSLQWQPDPQSPSRKYLVYRLAACVFCAASYLVYLLEFRHPDFLPVYLTTWGATVLCAQQVLDAALAVLAFKRRGVKRSGSTTPASYRANWFLSNVSSSAAVSITILALAFLFRPGESKGNPSYGMVFAHALNTVVVVSDLFFSAKPWRWQHAYQPFTFSLMYTLFTVLYFSFGGLNPHGGTAIYPQLDWGGDGAFTTTLPVVLLGNLGIMLVHLSLCCLHALRTCLYENCYLQRLQQKQVTDEESAATSEKQPHQ